MSQCSSCGQTVKIVFDNSLINGTSNTFTTTSCGCGTNCSTCDDSCTSCQCNNCTTECPQGSIWGSCITYNGDDLSCLAVPITTATALNDVIEALAAAICVLEEGIVPDMCASLGTASIDCLEDVTITTPADNQFLRYVTDEWVNSVIVLDDLDDVIITTPTDNDVLTYNGTNWVNQAPAYKSYVAIVTQSGSGNPTATIIYNTLGTVTWTRTGAGTFRAATSSLYTINKTVGFITSANTTNVTIFSGAPTTSSQYNIKQNNSVTGNAVDGFTIQIEIRVYN